MISQDVASNNLFASKTKTTSAQQQEAIARCLYLQNQQRPFGLIVGESGCGKSYVLREFQQRCRQTSTTFIEMTGLDQDGFLFELETELGLCQPTTGQNKLVRVEQRLRSLVECGSSQTLLLDHLNEADESVMTVLRRLLRMHARFPSLTILGTATPPLHRSLVQLVNDFADLRIEIGHPDPAETEQHIQQHLSVHGSSEAISETAADQIRTITSGVPRELERLMRLIPQAAAMSSSRKTTPEQIAGLAEELPTVR